MSSTFNHVYGIDDKQLFKITIEENHTLKQQVVFYYDQYLEPSPTINVYSLLVTKYDIDIYVASNSGLYCIDMINHNCHKIMTNIYNKILFGGKEGIIIGYNTQHLHKLDKISVHSKSVIATYSLYDKIHKSKLKSVGKGVLITQSEQANSNINIIDSNKDYCYCKLITKSCATAYNLKHNMFLYANRSDLVYSIPLQNQTLDYIDMLGIEGL